MHRTFWRASRGFTLMEIMVVTAIIAIATGLAVVGWSGGAQRQLADEGERLAMLLEAARLHARASGQSVRWRATPEGFVFEGRTRHWLDRLPTTWERAGTVVLQGGDLQLGPEPILPPQSVTLGDRRHPSLRVTIATDGLAPFQVQEATP